MQKQIKVGKFDTGYAWWFLVDGHIVDTGFDEDPSTANRQAKEAAAKFEENR